MTGLKEDKVHRLPQGLLILFSFMQKQRIWDLKLQLEKSSMIKSRNMVKYNTYLSFTVQAGRENKKYSQIKDYRPSFVFVYLHICIKYKQHLETYKNEIYALLCTKTH